MRERQPWKYKQFVPGSPEPSEYEIRNFSPYKIHQRCAEKFRWGRVLLAADAAHVCNAIASSFPSDPILMSQRNLTIEQRRNGFDRRSCRC